MGQYLDTVLLELMKCNERLGEVQKVIDSLIADYADVPVLKQLLDKRELYSINEEIAKAKSSVEVIVLDAQRKKREKNG